GALCAQTLRGHQRFTRVCALTPSLASRLGRQDRRNPMRALVRRFVLAAIAACAFVPASAHASFVRDIDWTSSSPAAGAQLLSGTFSDPAVHPSWTVTIEAPTQSPFDGTAELAEAGSAASADQTVSALSAKGFTARQDTLSWPRY